MLDSLGPLHALAARRGDGLLPEFARLWAHLARANVIAAQATEADPKPAGARPPLAQIHASEMEPTLGDNIVPLAAEATRPGWRRLKR